MSGFTVIESITFFRLIRELRERYLHSGSPLELPAEIRVKLNMSKSTWLSLEQIEELQKAMIIRLRKYWYKIIILKIVLPQILYNIIFYTLYVGALDFSFIIEKRTTYLLLVHVLSLRYVPIQLQWP